MVVLDNKVLTVKINELGAEIKSIQKDGKEYMWGSNPEIWGGSAPIMFPICGGLKDDKYILNGKEYNLVKHGFARFKTFTVEKQTETSATFLMLSDEETKKSFPFDFEFRAVFTLKNNSLKVEYKVKNLTDETMYFSVGSHEAYSTPEGIEDYDVIFPKKETLNATILNGNLLEKNSLPIIKDSNIIPLYDKYFLIDALVFTDLKSRSATLRNRKTGKQVKVDFPNCDYFLLWHKHGAGYICLEPWGGIQDYETSDYDITHKPGITALKAKGEHKNAHTITIEK